MKFQKDKYEPSSETQRKVTEKWRNDKRMQAYLDKIPSYGETEWWHQQDQDANWIAKNGG